MVNGQAFRIKTLPQSRRLALTAVHGCT